jgi:drug/metabolite transporter (DMT)-like permease
MTTAAFSLVLVAAAAHATWNYLLKRSDHKVAFLWSFTCVSFLGFLVPAIAYAAIDGIGWRGLAFGLASGGLHAAYGLSLSYGYQVGDLSAVYPISRGMGPALIPPAAVLLLGERVSGWAGLGIALVVIGVLLVQAQTDEPRELLQHLRGLGRPAIVSALATGVLITTYSLWDKKALDYLSPVTLNQFSIGGYVFFLSPLAYRARHPVRAEWRARGWSIVAAGALAPLAYILVLIALTTSRVSYVAPTREVGIVLGALLGVVLLHEGYGRARIAGALLIVGGVLTLGLAP